MTDARTDLPLASRPANPPLREVKVRLSSAMVLRLHREKIMHGTTIASLVEEALELYLAMRPEPTPRGAPSVTESVSVPLQTA